MITKKYYLAPDAMEKQEDLSLSRLALLVPKNGKYSDIQEDRPEANFIDLVDWVSRNFCSALKNKTYLNKFVHNRIIIDGQFLQFCEERSITVECLYKDSIISWATENNYEKFFAQGVFLIKNRGVEFLHAALFHKGNQNEDEISFFVICSETNYKGYVKLRNEFDAWVVERDRGNLHIRVVEGEDLPYTKDNTWEDIFLPPDTKEEIKGLVENFLSSQEFYSKNKIPWKRGILLYGKPGNGKTSIIRTIMSMYNFKPVTIAPGANEEALREAFSYAEEQCPALLYLEDLDSLLEKNVDPSAF